MQDHSIDPLVGALVDNRYRVISRIADGGMSTVYQARHESLDRLVALKIPHRNLSSDPHFVARFAQEARNAARLTHPNVVQVMDHGNSSAGPYLVMEYVQGETLRDLLRRRGALPPRLALALLAPALEGLAAAHAAGLIHRDIKPENILLSSDGQVKVGDFGLARPISNQTSTGELVGTAAYLAPELFQRRNADERSDVYSTGILLYELLTGRVPFTGEMSIQVAYQHISEPVPPPSSLVPGLANDLDELVHWAAAKDPEDRPVDANAFLGELRHVATTLPAEQLDLEPPLALTHPVRLPARTESPFAPRQAAADASTPESPAAAAEGVTEVVSPSFATQALSPAHDAGLRTEVFDQQQHPTSVVPVDAQPTTVLSAGAGQTTVLPGLSAEPAPSGLSRRAEKKLAKQRERDTAKALATPLEQVRMGNPRRRGLIWLIIVIVAALLASTAGWYFGFGPGAQVSVPDVKSKPADQAAAMLKGLGLQSSEQLVFDDVVGQGLVVATQPDAYASIPKFQVVQILVSKGPQLFPVPKISGLTVDSARTTLNQSGLALGKGSEDYSESVPKGQIVSQDPAAAAEVRRSTPVNYVLSKGPQPINVPSTVGKTQDDATAQLKQAGFDVAVAAETVFSRDVPEGSVVAQSPANGTAVRGSKVTLTISKGPRMVDVPNFVGKQATDAKKQLEDLGFNVKINNVLDGFFGTVRFQNPAGGQAPEGSTITLTVI